MSGSQLQSLPALARFPQINPEPVMAVTTDGEIAYANEAAAVLLRGWDAVEGGPLPPAWRQAVSEVMAGEEAVELNAPVADRLFSFRLVPDMETGCLHLYATDDTDAHEARMRLRHLAYYDLLTGLPNRTHLLQYLERTWPHETATSAFALLYLGADRFKNIVSGLGHTQGDRVLSAVAERLSGLFPRGFVARVHGDEFAVVVPDIADMNAARSEAARIQQAFSSPVCSERAPFPISLSVGIVLGWSGRDGAGLLRDSHSAMARAKSTGPGRERVFDESLQKAFRDRLRLETDLGAALEADGQLVVHYQPILTLPEIQPVAVGFEALVRWNHPDFGRLGPGAFIALAEDAGLVGRLGWRVLEQAAQQAAVWNRGTASPATVSVNLAPQQVVEAGLVEKVETILQEVDCEPAWIRLELTESALVGDPDWVRGNLEGLREIGCSLSIDDFGTGYSSLSHLHRFPFDTLKVDRAFVVDAPTHSRSFELVRAIMAMSESLGLAVVAEGVETDEQLELVRGAGAAYVQGFRFAPALPAPEAEAWL
ncbi:putative bifunctional diguanylate cyclase/phosphodiesterase [Thiohalorhabdus sp. Cl-TMA]|uniref:Bifunctional diguanylate cyclase/phosphodiesterase n=1 Tax=Thiohalorhabdus methylotrophus TaxID=3242694 RepID=A0ABV4TW53_9GAMM